MKRNRNEAVFTAVGRYMKRRQIIEGDSFKKSELKLQQTVQDLCLHEMVKTETGVRNVVSYSSISGDATAIDQQFSRLKTFIAEASEPYKSELTYVLFPVFVHLYLELVNSGQKTPAQKFHARYSGLFLHADQYKAVTDCLPNILAPTDLPSYSQIKEFRENKYCVKLSEGSLEYINRFLKDNDHLILLQILSLYIDFELPVVEPDSKVQNDVKFPLNHFTSKVENHVGSQDVTAGSKESTHYLKEIIKKIRDGPPSLPSVCLYTLKNSYPGMCSTSVCHKKALLACGFEDSSVRLWSLTARSLVSEPTDLQVSKVRLACDASDNEFSSLSAPEECKVLRGHSAAVYGVSFVPRSDILLSCSGDTTVRAWNLNTHTNVVIYRGHGYPVWNIDVGPMGFYFATASKDQTAKIWSLDRTFPLRILAGHNMDVDCVKFHPNSNYIATGSSDRSVRLWSVQEGRLVRTFPGHRGTIFALAFSPDGQYLASAGEDRGIKIWDLAMSTLVKELRGHSDTVYSLCFNQEGSVLASGGIEHYLRFWHVKKNSPATAAGNSTPTTTTPGGMPAVESYNSPELLTSFATKEISLHLVQYGTHNLLTAVGVNNTRTSQT